MKPERRYIVFALAGLLVLGLILVVSPGTAQQPGQTAGMCYAAADNEDVPGDIDFVSQVDYITAQETPIGLTGTKDIEAIAYQASTGTLFAANGGQLGTINLTTGAFTARSQPFGTAQGSDGPVTLSDVDGMAFNPLNGVLYGTHRRATPDTLGDVLFQINPATGAFVPGAFAGGADYVVVQPPPGGFNDIDDIAIDIIDQQMYGIANNGGVGDRLVIIDKQTGETIDLGVIGVNDMEGLAFDPTGQLLGTTGKEGGSTSNSLFHIDKTTAKADVSSAVALPNASDYEAVDCLLSWTPEPPPPATTEPTAVELLYFRVEGLKGRQVNLAWATASEINTYGFNVYRSSDSSFSHASRVYFASAKGGTGETRYTFTDTAPAEGRYWYWLEEVETQGGVTLSSPVTTLIGSTNTSGSIFLPLVRRPAGR